MKKRFVVVAFAVFWLTVFAGVALAADYYGAIATSDSGAYGYAYDYSTREQAEAAALEECGDEDCRVQVWFKNACGAVAKDGTNLGWAWDESREQAQATALSQCGTGACKVVSWACTSR